MISDASAFQLIALEDLHMNLPESEGSECRNQRFQWISWSSYMEVPKIGVSPISSNPNRIFSYKPSILDIPIYGTPHTISGFHSLFASYRRIKKPIIAFNVHHFWSSLTRYSVSQSFTAKMAHVKFWQVFGQESPPTWECQDHRSNNTRLVGSQAVHITKFMQHAWTGKRDSKETRMCQIRVPKQIGQLLLLFLFLLFLLSSLSWFLLLVALPFPVQNTSPGLPGLKNNNKPKP